jgi:bacteriocin-like protein
MGAVVAARSIVPWGTASLLPREQHEPVYHGILPTIRRTDAVVASEAESKRRSHMNTEMRELTDEELNCVSGGGQTTTQQVLDAVSNAVAWIPLFGTVYKTTYDTAKQLLA